MTFSKFSYQIFQKIPLRKLDFDGSVIMYIFSQTKIYMP